MKHFYKSSLFCVTIPEFVQWRYSRVKRKVKIDSFRGFGKKVNFVRIEGAVLEL